MRIYYDNRLVIIAQTISSNFLGENFHITKLIKENFLYNLKYFKQILLAKSF